ncbi:hypothetical protein MRX96_056171 [Rhipicephalus microplus]
MPAKDTTKIFAAFTRLKCQSGAKLQRLFEIEESVLSLLNDAVSRGRNNIARVRPKKLEALIRNVSVTEWTHLVIVYVREYEKPAPVSFLFRPIKCSLVALDKMFYMYKQADLMAHLAWWFVQMHTVLGSASGHVIFAGNLENAAKLMAVDCYDMISEKLGLLLAAESAISLFTAPERHHLNSLLMRLKELVIEMVSLLPWSEKSRRYVASKIARLQVVTFPENLENLDAYLSDKYSTFLESKWLYVTLLGHGLEKGCTASMTANYEFMQYRWRTYHLELVDYDYWTNQANNRSPCPPTDTGYLLNVGEHYFSDEQVFFVIYCLTICDKKMTYPCNALLKSFAPFGDAFRCRMGTPMHDHDRCGIISGMRDKLKNKKPGRT